MTPPLPTGFTARINPHVRHYDDGRTLVGGSPVRVLRLTDAARKLLSADTIEVRSPTEQVLTDRLLDTGIADPVLDTLPDIGPELLTVVIPVKDRPHQLQRLLDSIGPRIRVIVIDDASTDPQATAAVASRHGAEMIHLARNVGPAAARNHGLRLVETPYVGFVDSDVVLEPGTLATLLKHFHDPLVALAAPRIASLTQADTTGWIHRYEDHRSSLDLGSQPSLVKPGTPVSWVPSACVVARTAALGEGFDPSLRVAEDVDLVWRLADQGWRIRYEPIAVARHEHRATLRTWLARKAYYGTGADLLARRHGRHVAPAVVSPWAACFVVAVLAQRRWSAPIALAAAAAATLGIHRKVQNTTTPIRISLTLTTNGALAATAQASALLLRHWWPAATAACSISPRARRAVLVATVLDTAVEYHKGTSLDPVRFAAARRLDDLAYGAGLWQGALRGRSLRALMPVFSRNRPVARGK